jgi:1,4-alpha-glucan branching enzyme
MKNFLLSILILAPFFINAQIVSTTPTVFEATQPVTINFNKTGTPLAAYTGTIYAYIGVTVNGTRWQNVKSPWAVNTVPTAMTLVSGTTYKLDIAPSLFSFFGTPTTSNITEICVVFRNDLGTSQSIDYFLNVGAFQSSLSAPVPNSTTILTAGQSLPITASNSGGSCNYTLFGNGGFMTGSTGTTFSYTDLNLQANKSYELKVSQGAVTFTYKFFVIIAPTVVNAALSIGLEDGINYNPTDATKATLVLNAPGKDFVYVAGSFNNWNPGTSFAMKKDPTTGKFWLELTGLVSMQNYTYQYWVVDQTPFLNSPKLVKTADPFSTLVLSPFDDPYISAISYPNIPTYPVGQEREVSVLQTGQTPYVWQVSNFVKPPKENLVIYEILIRDFNSNRNYQELIDKIDYFKGLKINAIELMPVMEFEGDEGWGYNPVYHLANDKYYGTANKLREFIDLCHLNGIAVIMDVALNHAFGRSPLVRMWMKDPDGDGWGDASGESPYFNEFAKHAYGVGNDFNHTQPLTKYYTQRVIKNWIKDYHIDGFRWDLTKGFTQSCVSGDEACTNIYQQDRVDILKQYADYSWGQDQTHYVIFEHLGIDSEEQQWANYRIAETPSKGIMLWGKMTDQYNQLTMGFNSSNDITRVGNVSRGFTEKRVIGYAESHDEENLMYKNVTFGNNTNPAHNVRNLNTALYRTSALGAALLLVPGPKMIWHFAPLGLEQSIYACSDGTVNTGIDAIPGDCKLATKLQPQWTGNFLGVPERAKIYNDWAKMIDLKKNNPVFKANYSINSGTTLQPKIYIWDDALPASQLKNVVVLTNFDVNAQNITPNFPYVGTWVNLIDNTAISVSSTTAPINIEAGGFRVYGNQSTLAVQNFNPLETINIFPNPANTYFTLSKENVKVTVYNLTGQVVKNFSSKSELNQYDIADLQLGVYLIKVTDEMQHEKTLRLIKN